MANEQAPNPELDRPRHDVPDKLVLDALSKLMDRKIHPPHHVPEWETLKSDPARQNFVRYIESASQLLAPDDAELRGNVATALTALYYMREDADTIYELTTSWGMDLEEFFQSTPEAPPPPDDHLAA